MTIAPSTMKPARIAAVPSIRPRVLTPEQALRERQAVLMIKLVFLIAALAIALTVLARLTGIGTELVARGAPVEARAITLIQHADGHLVMADAMTGAVHSDSTPVQGGFLRGVVRAFSLKRNAQGVPQEAPYAVTRWDSGRVTLNDLSTGHQVPLDSYGPSVSRIFEPLFVSPATDGGAALNQIKSEQTQAN
jgi:putative photosynthetic complex assembly protein